MNEYNNDVFDNQFCIVKRHKGRGRYELYIHDEPLRSFIKQHQFMVISEDLKEVKPFKKKMLFKAQSFGELLTTLLDRVAMLRENERENPEKIVLLLETFNALARSTLHNFEIKDFESEGDYMDACYGDLLLWLNQN